MMKYVAKFNEISHFSPANATIDEMRMERFEHALEGKINKEVAGNSYASF